MTINLLRIRFGSTGYTAAWLYLTFLFLRWGVGEIKYVIMIKTNYLWRVKRLKARDKSGKEFYELCMIYTI
jgi:hypothetical protein